MSINISQCDHIDLPLIIKEYQLESLSAIAAKWFLDLKYEDLPADIVKETQRSILNTIAVATAASGLEYGPPIRATAKDLGCIGKSQLFGYGDKTSKLTAAFANATWTAALAFDDSHTETLIHVYGTIVSTVLALAQEHQTSGKEVLVTIAGASELMCRTGVIAPSEFHRNGLHPTGIIGAIGAAYAAARILRLNLPQTINAIGIVGNMASGINQCWVDGTWSQLVDNGWAAQAGITAATMAGHGFTGSPEVLEGKLGLFRSHIQKNGYQFDFDRMIRGFGEIWEMRQIEIKPYPCGHVSQPFVDCILSMHREGLRHEDIDRITCLVADWMVPVVCEPEVQKKRPTTPWHGRVSLPYTIAESLYFGRLNAESYRQENLQSREILNLVDRIDYIIDDSAKVSRSYKGWIRIQTKNGETLEAIKHDQENSDRSLSEKDFMTKIKSCFEMSPCPIDVESFLREVYALDKAPSVEALMKSCDAKQ